MSNSSKDKPFAIIVGAGLGGLATALRLRQAGFRLQVWDLNPQVGGKIQEYRELGYRWDLGPSLLTLPHVIEEVFQKINRRREDYLQWIPLKNTCRYFWRDGTVINENDEFWTNKEIAAFLAHGRGVYELSGKAYLEHPPSDFWKAFQLKNWKSLRHLPLLMSFKTLSQLVDQKIKEPHLRQIFYRFATYNGSSPYLTPSTFSIIPYVEAHFGGWYIKGGMRKIVETFEKIAREEGVEFIPSERAVSYEGGILTSDRGRQERPDLIVCNGEVIRASQTWLKKSFSDKEKTKLTTPALSSAGFIILLGVRGENRKLNHHNILFSDDYRAEFQSIFEKKELPLDPTIYISITQREDSDDAPAGGENWFILVNAPAKTDFPEEKWSLYAEHVIETLRRRGALLESQMIEVKKIIHAGEMAWRDQSSEGALYGWASHSILSALFRPSMKKKDEPIYFVGGSTHPGGGIPLVLLSAKMICEKIFNNFFIGKIK